MVFQGYWSCDRCGAILDLEPDLDSPTRCPRCKKPTAVWHPAAIPDPVQTPAPVLLPSRPA